MEHEKTVFLEGTYTGEHVVVHLQDQWFDTPVEPGHEVNLIAEKVVGADGALHAVCKFEAGAHSILLQEQALPGASLTCLCCTDGALHVSCKFEVLLQEAVHKAGRLCGTHQLHVTNASAFEAAECCECKFSLQQWLAAEVCQSVFGDNTRLKRYKCAADARLTRFMVNNTRSCIL